MTLRRFAGVGLRRGIRTIGAATAAGATDYISEFLTLSPYFGFRADNVLLNAGKAQTLYDFSANARNATQATSGAWPTVMPTGMNGKPSLAYPTGGFHDVPSFALGPFTAVLVAKVGLDSSSAWSHNLPQDTYFFRFGGKMRTARTVTGSSIMDSPAIDGNPRLYLYSVDALHSSHAQRFNGSPVSMTAIGTGNPGSGSATGVSRINGFSNGTTQSKVLELAEIWLFPFLSGANIATVENALKSRYGV